MKPRKNTINKDEIKQLVRNVLDERKEPKDVTKKPWFVYTHLILSIVGGLGVGIPWLISQFEAKGPKFEMSIGALSIGKGPENVSSLLFNATIFNNGTEALLPESIELVVTIDDIEIPFQSATIPINLDTSASIIYEQKLQETDLNKIDHIVPYHPYIGTLFYIARIPNEQILKRKDPEVNFKFTCTDLKKRKYHWGYSNKLDQQFRKGMSMPKYNIRSRDDSVNTK